MTDAAPLAEGTIEIRVRYAEVDRFGVLHHRRYWVFFEMGRTELLRAGGGSYKECEDRGVFFVLSKCSCRFLGPARYDDVLTLRTRITKMGMARIDHAYDLRRPADGTLLATAETTLACVDAEGKVQAIPEFVRHPEEA